MPLQARNQNDDRNRKMVDKIEVTISRLRMLKDHISELKQHFEELREIQLTDESDMPLCNKCGLKIEPNYKVVVKNSDGEERSHYHEECFKNLLK